MATLQQVIKYVLAYGHCVFWRAWFVGHWLVCVIIKCYTSFCLSHSNVVPVVHVPVPVTLRTVLLPLLLPLWCWPTHTGICHPVSLWKHSCPCQCVCQLLVDRKTLIKIKGRSQQAWKLWPCSITSVSTPDAYKPPHGAHQPLNSPNLIIYM